MRIVVTGLCVTYPLGGVYWDYIQYVLGLVELGHEVLYLEDTATPCYAPEEQLFTADAEKNVARFQQNLAQHDPALLTRWHYRDVAGRCYGMEWSEVARFCRSAELFLQVTASTYMREEYLAAERRALIDSDPMYTPATRPGYVPESANEQQHMETTRAHDVFFTFGENVGAPDCRIETKEFDWQPTRQPIVLACFEPWRVPLAERRRVFSTVASWEPGTFRPTIDGVRCGGKSCEFERFVAMPSRVEMPIELALSGSIPRDLLLRHGWLLQDAYEISRDPWIYRDYLARSFGEWSVAKQAYVAGRTGWISCRSACYLALGVPTVVQDTGFRDRIPTGEGFLAFANYEEAVEAMEAVQSHPERHARAAIEIAREHFDSKRVLGALLERSFLSARRPRQGRELLVSKTDSLRGRESE